MPQPYWKQVLEQNNTNLVPEEEEIPYWKQILQQNPTTYPLEEETIPNTLDSTLQIQEEQVEDISYDNYTTYADEYNNLHPKTKESLKDFTMGTDYNDIDGKPQSINSPREYAMHMMSNEDDANKKSWQFIAEDGQVLRDRIIKQDFNNRRQDSINGMVTEMLSGGELTTDDLNLVQKATTGDEQAIQELSWKKSPKSLKEMMNERAGKIRTPQQAKEDKLRIQNAVKGSNAVSKEYEDWVSHAWDDPVGFYEAMGDPLTQGLQNLVSAGLGEIMNIVPVAISGMRKNMDFLSYIETARFDFEERLADKLESQGRLEDAKFYRDKSKQDREGFVENVEEKDKKVEEFFYGVSENIKDWANTSMSADPITGRLAKPAENFLDYVDPRRIWTAVAHNAPLMAVFAAESVFAPNVAAFHMAAVGGGSVKTSMLEWEKKTGNRLTPFQRESIPIITGTAIAYLEKLGIEAVLGKLPIPMKSKIMKALVSAFTERETEGLQEFIEVWAAVKDSPEYYKLDLPSVGYRDLTQNDLDAIKVAKYAGFVMGGAGGGVAAQFQTDSETEYSSSDRKLANNVVINTSNFTLAGIDTPVYTVVSTNRDDDIVDQSKKFFNKKEADEYKKQKQAEIATRLAQNGGEREVNGEIIPDGEVLTDTDSDFEIVYETEGAAIVSDYHDSDIMDLSERNLSTDEQITIAPRTGKRNSNKVLNHVTSQMVHVEKVISAIQSKMQQAETSGDQKAYYTALKDLGRAVDLKNNIKARLLYAERKITAPDVRLIDKKNREYLSDYQGREWAVRTPEGEIVTAEREQQVVTPEETEAAPEGVEEEVTEPTEYERFVKKGGEEVSPKTVFNIATKISEGKELSAEEQDMRNDPVVAERVEIVLTSKKKVAEEEVSVEAPAIIDQDLDTRVKTDLAEDEDIIDLSIVSAPTGMPQKWTMTTKDGKSVPIRIKTIKQIEKYAKHLGKKLYGTEFVNGWVDSDKDYVQDNVGYAEEIIDAMETVLTGRDLAFDDDFNVIDAKEVEGEAEAAAAEDITDEEGTVLLEAGFGITKQTVQDIFKKIVEPGSFKFSNLPKVYQREAEKRGVTKENFQELFSQIEGEHDKKSGDFKVEGLDKKQNAFFKRVLNKRIKPWFAKRPASYQVKIANPEAALLAKYLTKEEIAGLTPGKANNLVSIYKNLEESGVVEDMPYMAMAGIVKKGWYKGSAKAIVDVFGVEDGYRFAALLSAMSPQTSVESNLKNALSVWVNWDKAGRPSGKKAIPKILKIMGESVEGEKGIKSVLGAWRNNSFRAFNAKDPSKIEISGPKVQSFFQNLIGNEIEVTNDTWMANVSYTGEGSITQEAFGGIDSDVDEIGVVARKSGGYLAMNAAVRIAAKKLNSKKIFKEQGVKWKPAEVQETVWSWAKAALESRAKGTGTIPKMVEKGMISEEVIAGTPDFAQLLQTPIFRDILKGTKYEKRINELEKTERVVIETSLPKKSKHLGRSAARLEDLYQERESQKAEKEKLEALEKIRKGKPEATPEDSEGIQYLQGGIGLTQGSVQGIYNSFIKTKTYVHGMLPEKVRKQGEVLGINSGNFSKNFSKAAKNLGGLAKNTKAWFKKVFTHMKRWYKTHRKIPVYQEGTLSPEMEDKYSIVSEEVHKQKIAEDKQGKKPKDPQSLTTSIKDLVEVLSVRAKKVGVEVKKVLRDYQKDLDKNTIQDMEKVEGFLAIYKKLKEDAPDTIRKLDVAILLRDKAAIDMIIEQYPEVEVEVNNKKVVLSLKTEFNDNVRNLMTDMWNRGNVAFQGKLGLIEAEDGKIGYFPREVNNLDGLREVLRGLLFDKLGAKEATGVIDDGLAEYALKQEKTVDELTVNETSRAINQIIFKRLKGKKGVSFSKGRTIDTEDIALMNELAPFYNDSATSLVDYIQKMNEGMAKQRLFGKGINYDTLEFEDDFEGTIGGLYAEKLLSKENYTPAEQREIVNIFSTILETKHTPKIISTIKAFGYIGTMADFINTLTQLGDTAVALGRSLTSNPLDVATSFGRAAIGKSEISLRDVYIDNISTEMRTAEGMMRLVNKIFKRTGLKWLDRIGKETLINSQVMKFRKDAMVYRKQRGLSKDVMTTRALEFEIKLSESFNKGEFDTVINELIAGEYTPNTIALAYNSLLDHQPVALTELPAVYSRNPNARVFYQLKTWAIKTLNVFAEDIQGNNKVANRLEEQGNLEAARKLRRSGYKKAIQLGVVLSIAGGGVEQIKDLLLGKPTKFSDNVIESLMRLFFLSKYTTDKLFEGDLGQLWDTATEIPVIGIGESVIKDIGLVGRWATVGLTDKESLEYGLSFTKHVPFVGKFVYYGGRGRKMELQKAVRAYKNQARLTAAERRMLNFYERELNKIKQFEKRGKKVSRGKGSKRGRSRSRSRGRRS